MEIIQDQFLRSAYKFFIYLFFFCIYFRISLPLDLLVLSHNYYVEFSFSFQRHRKYG